MNDKDTRHSANAIALHYNGNGAPRVVAKGGGVVAERIIETARAHGVPLEENTALVAALARVELGREIPRELYIAVAHVLAFAWEVAGKKKVTAREEKKLSVEG
jgi:flagellar biosynthesis protein